MHKAKNVFIVVFFLLTVTSFTQDGLNIKIAYNKKYLISDKQRQIDILHYHHKFDLNTKEKILNGVSKITAIEFPLSNKTGCLLVSWAKIIPSKTKNNWIPIPKNGLNVYL